MLNGCAMGILSMFRTFTVHRNFKGDTTARDIINLANLVSLLQTMLELMDADTALYEEQRSSIPTKKCVQCAYICHTRCKKCVGCGQVFSPSKKRMASGAPRKYATDLLSQLQKKTDQLHQLGYEIVVLGHKDNPVHKSFPIMHTDGSGEEFLGRYPQIVKLWKQYFKTTDNPPTTVADATSDPRATITDATSDPHATITDATSDPHATITDAMSDPRATITDAMSDPGATITDATSDPRAIITDEINKSRVKRKRSLTGFQPPKSSDGVRKRRRRCKNCERCMAPKCNNCTYCINPNSKQSCINRKCLNME